MPHVAVMAGDMNFHGWNAVAGGEAEVVLDKNVSL